ncbi:hypothetical protein [Pseudoclavibacter sp. VKM Ac-2888]|uniref:hypothetical protein n=1 Tax=Pseudoclavibacter sp. VKM Ac-2888 TaxID=2783830 RepID=UPI00188AFF3F|nr:hypothetical protein [Pseudoclavibacter sp. VKM Ac-2888]MBF4549737.1 hypothetical protein [Pseudoclavibacter sp. VKM Ac-2888]
MNPLHRDVRMAILERILMLGDEAETGYLEVKSDVDLTKPLGRAKVAKFLLGAANREPTSASRFFHGHAVMVIGAQQGSAPGIPKGIEDHELLRSLGPYVGEQFPLPEIFRLPAGEDPTREVLVVVAMPPEPGQTMFPCHKAFQPSDKQDTKHSLANGAIYVRTSTETRVAQNGGDPSVGAPCAGWRAA